MDCSSNEGYDEWLSLGIATDTDRVDSLDPDQPR